MSTPDLKSGEDYEFHEEWLSAYLDDELSPEQRQVVEQRLLTDPAVRQVLADLETIRGAIGQLPAWPEGSLEFPVEQILATDSGIIEAGDYHENLSGGVKPITAPESQTHASRIPKGSTAGVYLGWFRPLAVAAGLVAMLGIAFAMWKGQPISPLADATRNRVAPARPSSANESRAVSDGVGAASESPPPANGSYTNGLEMREDSKQLARPLQTRRQAQQEDLSVTPMAAAADYQPQLKAESSLADNPSTVLALPLADIPLQIGHSTAWSEMEVHAAMENLASVLGRRFADGRRPSGGNLPRADAAIAGGQTRAANIPLVMSTLEFPLNGHELLADMVQAVATNITRLAYPPGTASADGAEAKASPIDPTIALFVTRGEAKDILQQIEGRRTTSGAVWITSGELKIDEILPDQKVILLLTPRS